MLKRFLIATVAIFVAWMAVDLALHRFVLGPLFYGVIFGLIASYFFLFELLVSPKTVKTGLQFGAILGFVIGLSVGFGTYIHMPVPLALAWGWFLGGWIKAVLAGAILGALPRK